MTAPDWDTLGERITRRLMQADPEGWAAAFLPDGSARTAQWHAEDHWIIAYSTERVYGNPQAPFDGKFVAMTYRPVGKGARTGKAERWRRTYMRGFATRKAAKARALALYREHSPKWAARNPA